FQLFKLRERVIAELRQLDVMGHIQVEIIGAQTRQRTLQRSAHELWRKILLALLMRPRLARIGVKIVAEFSADLDPGSIDLRRLHPMPKERLSAAVAVGVAVVEECDALVEREAAN